MRTRQGVPASEIALLATSPSEPGAPRSEEPEGDDPWIGRVVANVYEIEERIGVGGMGAVYRARHVNLGKSVAIKVLVESIAKRRDAVERLRQEAIAASSIEHDHIVDVISFDHYEDGSVFIVMELLRGESLASRLDALHEAGQTMALEEAIPIALQIADALEAAHQRGIVHRDLKPDNVFLATKGGVERVKVLDFGISKIKMAEAEQVRVTRTGQIVGTPLYMSPEQARGESDIDRRADIYALGVILFELLSGAPPFDGRNYFELLWKHGNEPPPKLCERVERGGCPEALGAAVERALAKAPADRFETMAEFARALSDAVPTLQGTSSLLPSLQLSRFSPSLRPAAPTARTAADTIDDEAPDAAPDERAGTSGSKRMLWVGALGLMAVMATGLAVALGASEGPSDAEPGSERTLTRPPPSAEPEVRPEANPTSEGAPEPETTPAAGRALVTISLGSTPLGAEVSIGDQALCTTPCLADLPMGEEATLVFRRTGFHDAIESFTPSEDTTLAPRLRARRAGGGGAGPGLGPPIKTSL